MKTDAQNTRYEATAQDALGAVHAGTIREAPLASIALAEIEARLACIEEIFCHQQMSILESADLGKEYVERADTISRQNVAKTRGRPESGITRAVRQLPLPGKTEGARKKRLERLLRIASLGPQVRAVAQKAGVAHFQSDLLEIATGETEQEQLQTVAGLVARNRERALARKNRAGAGKQLRAVVAYSAERRRELDDALTKFAEDHEVNVELPNYRDRDFYSVKGCR